MNTIVKPLNRKTYGSIGHLPNSRMGPSDHAVPEGYAKICYTKPRKGDCVIVQEKLDGSCVGVANVGGEIHALGRAGWPAQSSKYEQHQIFAHWVRENVERFRSLLDEGERIVGEWLAQAHGTRYKLFHEPFVAFDIMREDKRICFHDFQSRVGGKFIVPNCIDICRDRGCAIERALSLLGPNGRHGAIDTVEGVVYRVEREGRVDFLAKYVRPDKVDGCFLPEVSGKPAIWNWRP